MSGASFKSKDSTTAPLDNKSLITSNHDVIPAWRGSVLFQQSRISSQKPGNYRQNQNQTIIAGRYTKCLHQDRWIIPSSHNIQATLALQWRSRAVALPCFITPYCPTAKLGGCLSNFEPHDLPSHNHRHLHLLPSKHVLQFVKHYSARAWCLRQRGPKEKSLAQQLTPNDCVADQSEIDQEIL